MLDHMVDAGCQLYPDKFKRAVCDWQIWKSPVSTNTQAALLPDALWGVDDGLHDVVPDELPVLVGNVIDRRLCG